MKLKSEEAIAQHVIAFPGVEPARKKEIADHLTHLPEGHLPAVRAVLDRDDETDPEVHFVRGCFEELPPAA